MVTTAMPIVPPGRMTPRRRRARVDLTVSACVEPRKRVALSCRRETGVPCPDARRVPTPATMSRRRPMGTTPVDEPASRFSHGDERAKYNLC